VNNKPEKNCDYILPFLPGGISPWTDYEKGYVICDIQLGGTWTPDLVARTGNWDAVVADVVANANAQDFDPNEESFSHKYLNVAAGPFNNIVGTLRATPGNVAQYSVDDMDGRTWTH